MFPSLFAGLEQTLLVAAGSVQPRCHCKDVQGQGGHGGHCLEVSAERGEGTVPTPVLCQSCSRDGAGMPRGGGGGARQGSASPG